MEPQGVTWKMVRGEMRRVVADDEDASFTDDSRDELMLVESVADYLDDIARVVDTVGRDNFPEDFLSPWETFQIDKYFNGPWFVDELDKLLKARALDDQITFIPNFRKALVGLYGKNHPYLEGLVPETEPKDATSKKHKLGNEHESVGMERPRKLLHLMPLGKPPNPPMRAERDRSNKTLKRNKSSHGSIRGTARLATPIDPILQANYPHEQDTHQKGPAKSPVLDNAAAALLQPPQGAVDSDRVDGTPESTEPEIAEQENSGQNASPEFEIIGELSSPVDNSPSISERDTENEAWLRRLLDPTAGGPASADDHSHRLYKGWKIEPPEIQLVRAKNFLADEDTDRTVDWPRKFAELAEYFAYLLFNYEGEDWGYDLREAIDMLHTHWVFENYHYGTPKMNLNLQPAKPKESQRLPRPVGPRIVLLPDDRSQDTLSVHRRLPRNPGRTRDFQHGISDDALDRYIQEYEADEREFWNTDARTKKRHPLGQHDPSLDKTHRWFNMARHENHVYEMCIDDNSMATTVQEIQKGYSPADDPVEQLDETERPNIDSLRSFSVYRGARRAALQQCLNRFANFENPSAGNPWQTLVLPAPYKARQLEERDAGMTYDTQFLEQIPAKDSRDPFAYTVAYRRYAEEEKRWSQWAREHSIRETYRYKRQLQREAPVMALPQNFKGPYVSDGRDSEMAKTYKELKQLRILLQGLERAGIWAPRKLLTEVLELIDRASQGEHWRGLGLHFRDDEFLEPDSVELQHLRPAEVGWLEHLASRSVNDGQYNSIWSPPAGHMFIDKIVDMLDDISPTAFFRTKEFKPLQGLLEALNGSAKGAAKRYQYGFEEAVCYATKASTQGLLKLERGEDQYQVARPDLDFHPEDCVFWEENGNEAPGSRHQAEQDPAAFDEYGFSDDNSVSTDVSVPGSEKPKDYEHHLPRRYAFMDDKVFEKRSYAYASHWADGEHQARVENFFRCLAYRLGFGIKMLSEQYKQMMQTLTPQQRESNKAFLETIVRYWENDTFSRPNDPRKNRDLIGSDRVTLFWPDIVANADPDSYKEKWGSIGEGPGPGPHEACHLVRKGLLREAWENKTLAYPSRIVPLKVRGHEASYLNERDPLWTFARTREGVGRWWNINRWPVHAQSKQTREQIKAGGPEKPRAQREPRRAAAEEVEELPHQREMAMPLAQVALSRRRFEPGTPQFWLGDTPLQQKYLEDRLRGRLETTDVDPCALPEVAAEDIIKSASPPPGSLVVEARSEATGDDVEMHEARAAPARLLGEQPTHTVEEATMAYLFGENAKNMPVPRPPSSTASRPSRPRRPESVIPSEPIDLDIVNDADAAEK